MRVSPKFAFYKAKHRREYLVDWSVYVYMYAIDCICLKSNIYSIWSIYSNITNRIIIMVSTTDIIGYFGGLCLSILTFPQVYKTFKNQNVYGISKWFLFFQLLTCVTFIIYGIRINDYPIIVANSLAGTGSVMLIILYCTLPSTKPGQVVAQSYVL